MRLLSNQSGMPPSSFPNSTPFLLNLSDAFSLKQDEISLHGDRVVFGYVKRQKKREFLPIQLGPYQPESFECVLFNRFVQEHPEIQYYKYSKDNLNEKFMSLVNRKQSKLPVAAIDIGTTSTKLALLDKSKNVHLIKVPTPKLRKNGKLIGDNIIELELTLGFLELMMLSYGVERTRGGIIRNNPRVRSVATEGMRRILASTLEKGDSYSRNVHQLDRLFEDYNLQVIDNKEESRLAYESLIQGAHQIFLKHFVTLDLGGGSSDFAFKTKEGEVNTFSLRRGMRFSDNQFKNGKSPFNASHIKSFKEKLIKHIAGELQPDDVGFSGLEAPVLLIGDRAELSAAVRKYCGANRYVHASEKNANPLTVAEIEEKLLSPEALDAYQELYEQTGNRFYRSLPIRLAFYQVFMTLYGINRVLIGAEGGLKMALLADVLKNGRPEYESYSILKKIWEQSNNP